MLFFWHINKLYLGHYCSINFLFIIETHQLTCIYLMRKIDLKMIYTHERRINQPDVIIYMKHRWQISRIIAHKNNKG